MKSLVDFISKTLKGGILYLLPIMIIYIVLSKAFDMLYPLAVKLSQPIQVGSETQVDPSYFLAVVVIVLLCFLFGMIASSSLGSGSIKWLENNILDIFPAYQLMKTASQSVVGMEGDHEFPVVLVPIDGWMFGLLMDELPNDEVLTFIPGAPNRWEGNLVIFKKNQVKSTQLSQRDVMSILRRTGIGASNLFERKNTNPTKKINH